MNGNGDVKNGWAHIIGKSVLLGSIQASIGSVELSSKFSVVNFSKDQETLQAAANALTSYIVVALFWTIGCILVMYANYGFRGFLTASITNMIMIMWIVAGYMVAFKRASTKYNLQYPKLFKNLI